jgi:ribosomal protein S18 acetylase RimI-like enzyme
MEYTIRACQPQDIDKLVLLCQKHADYEKSAYSPDGKSEALYKAIFENDRPLNCIVAEASGQLIGYATFTFDYSTWDARWFIYLDCLYLEEDYRSYGIGQALMEKVKENGKARNCVNMQWQTPDFNERAIKFYKRIGGTAKNKVRFTLPL